MKYSYFTEVCVCSLQGGNMGKQSWPGKWVRNTEEKYTSLSGTIILHKRTINISCSSNSLCKKIDGNYCIKWNLQGSTPVVHISVLSEMCKQIQFSRPFSPDICCLTYRFIKSLSSSKTLMHPPQHWRTFWFIALQLKGEPALKHCNK